VTAEICVNRPAALKAIKNISVLGRMLFKHRMWHVRVRLVASVPQRGWGNLGVLMLGSAAWSRAASEKDQGESMQE
jgi:hypothetical protein